MKKIISFLTVFTLLATLIATVNVTTVSAASTQLYGWEYFDEETQYIYTAPNKGGKDFHVATDATGSGASYQQSMTGVSDDPFLNIISSQYLCNYNSKVDMTKPVLDFSFKMYIPSADLNYARYIYLSLAKKDSEGLYTNNTYGTVYFTLTSTSGKTWGGASKNSTNVDRKAVAVSGDVWHQVNVRVFTNTEGQILYGMYMDDALVVLCKSTATDISFDDIGIRQIYFNTAANTYIKDIRLDLEDLDPTFAPAIPYSSVTFNTHTVNATTNALSAPNYGTVTDVLQTSSQTAAHFETTSGSTTVYKNVDYEVENDALKVTLTPSKTGTATHAMIQNFREDLTSYFPAGTTKYMQISYDVMSPEGSESALKLQKWAFGINTDEDYTNTSVYNITSKMQGNKIWFVNEKGKLNSYDGDETTKKSVEYDEVEAGKWYRIISLLKITNSGTDYIVHAEGYVMDIAADTISKIYEADEVIHKLNGTTDGFVLAQQRTDIQTVKDETQTSVVTYYDNIISRIWDTDFSTYYRDVDKASLEADDVFDLELNCINGAAVAKARDVAGIGTQKLILAAYDANGKMVKAMFSKNENISDDGEIAKLELDTSELGAATLKAFMFNGLSTGVPIMEHAVLDLTE